MQNRLHQGRTAESGASGASMPRALFRQKGLLGEIGSGDLKELGRGAYRKSGGCLLPKPLRSQK